MNTDHIPDESLAREIALGLQIGETQLWSALENITITGVEEVADPGASPSDVKVKSGSKKGPPFKKLAICKKSTFFVQSS